MNLPPEMLRRPSVTYLVRRFLAYISRGVSNDSEAIRADEPRSRPYRGWRGVFG
jgi:hypothetical protein